MTAGRVLELVGVRAVIQDVRQYLTDAKRIVKANEDIVRANDKLTIAGVKNKQVSDQEKAATAALAAVQSTQAEAAKKAAAAEKALADVRDRAKAALEKNRANAASGLLDASGAPRREIVPSTGREEKNLKQAKEDLKKANEELRKSEKAYKESARESTKAMNEQSNAADDLARSESDLAALQERRAAAALQAGAIIGGAIALGVTTKAIQKASEYQDALIKIDNLTDATSEQTAELGQRLLEVSKSLPIGATELAGAAYFALSSGIKDTAQALEIATIAAKAETIGFGETAQVAKFLTSTINAYGKENITAQQAIDLLTGAVKQGAGEASAYAQELGRVTGIAAALGVGLDEVLAITAQLSNTLGSTSEATTAVLGILSHINRVAPQSAKAFAGLGFSIKEVKDRIREVGLVQFLTELSAAAKGNSEALGDVFQDRRAVQGFFQLFNDGGKKVNETLQLTRKSAGSFEEAFKRANESFSNQAKILKNQINETLIEIGTEVLPQVTKGVRDLTKLFQENKDAIVAFASIGLNSAIIALQTLLSIIKGVSSVLKTMRDALASITGEKAAVVATLTAIGAALAFALPGSPYIKGLLLIQSILAGIGKQGGFNAVLQAGATGALAGGAIAGPAGAVIGGVGGAALASRQQNDRSRDQALETLIRALFERREALAKNEKSPTGIDVEKTNKEIETIVRELDKLDKIFGKQINSIQKRVAAEYADNKAKEDAEIKLQQRKQAEELDNEAIEQAKQKLQELQKTFQDSAENARQVVNLGAELKRFGVISQDLANALNLTATQAGNVQGYDAVVAATERANEAQYNYAATIATVASAFEESASVANQIVNDIASNALSAAQSASSALFSQPTQEVAQLNVELANLELAAARAASANRGLVRSLRNQIDEIDDQIRLQRRGNRDTKNAERDRNRERQEQQKAQKAAEKAQRDAERARERAERAIVDQLRIANLIARQSYERLDEGFSRLIDAQNQAASELQEAFLKNNSALQQQIQTAIGAGDTEGALALVEQQRQQADQYNEQAKAIQKNISSIEAQQKVAAAAERERQRQAELAEAYAQAQANAKNSTEENTTATEDDTSAEMEHTDSTELNTDALEDQKEALNEQIESLENGSDAEKEKIEAVKNQIKIYELESKALQALVVASNQSLLTQQEQRIVALALAADISKASKAIRDTSTSLLDLLPGVNAAELAERFKLLDGAVRALTDVGFRETLIDRGINPAQIALDLLAGTATRLAEKQETNAQRTQDLIDQQAAGVSEAERILAEGNNAVATTSRELTTEGNKAAGALNKSWFEAVRAAGGLNGLFGKTLDAALGLSNFKKKLDTVGSDLGAAVGKLIAQNSGGKKNAEGGFYSSPTNITIGETHQQELVLPLERPARARELIAQIPPSLMANIIGNRGGSAVFAPNINVTGETLDTMEAAAIRAVQRAFRSARDSSVRSGGTLTQGLGPAALRS